MSRCVAGLLLLLAASAPVFAQPGIVDTIAGGGPQAGASAAQVGVVPDAVAVDTAGNYYVAVTSQNRVYRFSAAGLLTAVIGNGFGGYAGDGGDPANAELNEPQGVAVDSAGDVYIADAENNRIRKVTFGSTPTISTVAGNGTSGFSGDGGSATSAQLRLPNGVAVDASGNIYIADTSNSRIRKVSSGTITTLAGNGSNGFSGDGSATANSLYFPYGVTIDSGGNVFIADTYNNRIRKVSGGTISSVAGDGAYASNGDGNTPLLAALKQPWSAAVDSSGNIYIADTFGSRIRRVSSGTISTVVNSSGTNGFSGDGGSPAAAEIYFPHGIALDGSGNLYIADTNNFRIRKVSANLSSIGTIAGNGTGFFGVDGGAPTAAQIYEPFGVAIDRAGNIYFSDQGNNRVRKVTPGPSPAITTVAGGGTTLGDGGSPTSASLNCPAGLAVDADGSLYIADTCNGRIRKVTFGASPAINTVAGGGSSFSDGGSPTSTSLLDPPESL